MKRLLLTSSEISTFDECRRRWWLTTHRGLRPVGWSEPVSGYLAVGSRVHEVLEEFYNPETSTESPESAMKFHGELVQGVRDDAQERGLKDFEQSDFEKDAQLTRIMLEGYFEWLEETGEDLKWEVLAAEREVTVRLGEVEGWEVWLLAKLDLQVRDLTSGFLWSVDHKTTGSFSDIESSAPLRTQFRHYTLVEHLLAEERGKDEVVRGIVVNALRRVKRTASAKPPFYQRITVPVNRHTVESQRKRTLSIARDIVRTEKALPMFEPDHPAVTSHHARYSEGRYCSWRCQFRSLCPLFDDGSDPESVLRTEYVSKNPLERYDRDVARVTEG